MIINRKELLRVLESVSPGLSAAEAVEQGNCFVFRDRTVTTFNDEICCRHDTLLDFEGAVPAKPFIETLRKLTEEEIDVKIVNGEIAIKGNRRKAGCRMQSDILLPCHAVEAPKTWTDVVPAFGEALVLVSDAAAKEDDNFSLTCVNITPDYVEACDAFQAIRYAVDTGVTQNVLVKQSACKALNGLGVAAIAETEAWIHFKTFTGLTISARKYIEEFPDISNIFVTESTGNLTLPGSIVDALAKALIFATESASGKQAIFRLKEGKMLIRGENQDGWYEEFREVNYSGPSMSFAVNPKYVASLLKHDMACEVTESSLRITGDSFTLVVALEKV
jgi:hypothetical protein